MGWKELIQKEGETVTLPWLGGHIIRSRSRSWTIRGKHPEEWGWYTFFISGRNARWNLLPPVEVDTRLLESLILPVRGYLVGDRLIRDDVSVDPDPQKIASFSEPVRLIETGLERFARIEAGRICEDGDLIFKNVDMPLGPEDEVLRAYEDRSESLSGVKGVTPALDSAFRMMSWQRKESERRRAELERQRLEEERRNRLFESLGDALSRREMAQFDFESAAKASLAVGGAEYLDSRSSYRPGEAIVRFRLEGRRFECTCDNRTLRIIDAGICLVDEENGSFFTLESLPSVILEAQREGVLVVFRHVD